MYDLLIENGQVIMENGVERQDIAIRGEQIETLLPPQSGAKAKRIIPATEYYVMPGGVDVHTHIQFLYGDFMTCDTFATGSIAAALGGTTTFIDFAIQPKGQSPLQAIAARKTEMAGSSVIDYALHSCLTDASDLAIDEIPAIIGGGIPSFKIYMTYRRDGKMVDDGALLTIIEKVKECGGLVGVHAENAAISEYLTDKHLREGRTEASYHPLSNPVIVETEAIQRAIFLAAHHNAPMYIYHLSSKQGLDLIVSAQQKGQPVYCETCSHYLALTDQVYNRPDAHRFLVSPPLRAQSDQDALWNGLATGTIASVASDGIALNAAQKLRGSNFDEYPKGLAGVEARVPLVWSEGVAKGKLTPVQFAKVVATNPAKTMGLYPKKGIIAPGSDADLVLLDPKKRQKLTAENLHMQVDYSIFDHIECEGYPVMTLCRGQILTEHGSYVGPKGHGRFVPAVIPAALLERSTPL